MLRFNSSSCGPRKRSCRESNDSRHDRLSFAVAVAVAVAGRLLGVEAGVFEASFEFVQNIGPEPIERLVDIVCAIGGERGSVVDHADAPARDAQSIRRLPRFNSVMTPTSTPAPFSRAGHPLASVSAASRLSAVINE